VSGVAETPLAGPPVERVVLATDLSAGAQRAVRRAALLPLAADGRIDLLHVAGPGPPRGRAEALATARGSLDAEAERLRARLARRGRAGVVVEAWVTTGRAYEEILRHARVRRAQLLIVGRHGGGGVRALVVGSTAERVVRGRVAPVLVVTADPRQPYRRSLVAVDTVSRFTSIVTVALRILPAELARLDVATAYEVVFEGYMRARGLSRASIERLRAREKVQALDTLREQLGGVVPAATQLELVARRGDPRRIIRDLVGQRAPDLLALGTHAHRGLARFLVGSVAADVLRHATADVLIVPRPEKLLATIGDTPGRAQPT
jgi:universal stress protein E